jgi:hypothetical protein
MEAEAEMEVCIGGRASEVEAAEAETAEMEVVEAEAAETEVVEAEAAETEAVEAEAAEAEGCIGGGSMYWKCRNVLEGHGSGLS